MKQAFASAHLLKILNHNFELIHWTAVLKAAHKNLDSKVAQVKGVILVWDICAKTSKHKENELAKATKVYKKTLGAKQKRQQAGLNAEKKI